MKLERRAASLLNALNAIAEIRTAKIRKFRRRRFSASSCSVSILAPHPWSNPRLYVSNAIVILVRMLFDPTLAHPVVSYATNSSCKPLLLCNRLMGARYNITLSHLSNPLGASHLDR